MTNATRLAAKEIIDRIIHFRFLTENNVPSFKARIDPAERRMHHKWWPINRQQAVTTSRNLEKSRLLLLKPGVVRAWMTALLDVDKLTDILGVEPG
jgi:hypothetical protein